MKLFIHFIYSIAIFSVISCYNTQDGNEESELIIQEQGVFSTGGKVIINEGVFDPKLHGFFNPTNQATEGQTLHGDHATVLYQIPINARPLPLVFWHGYGQSMRTWQTTPDGREGFQSIFLRKNYPVFLVDQPRRGLSGRSTESITTNTRAEDQLWFGIFRLGIDTTFYPNVQFSRKPQALNQFFRQITPDTGPLDINVNIDAMSSLFDRIGSGILVTHSHSGGQGWLTVIRNDNIRAVAAYEPGSNFVFPENDIPDSIAYVGGVLRARGVPKQEFMRLTKIPIIIFYGDYIPNEPVEQPGQEQWRAALSMATIWTETVNKYGGDVTLVHLPKIGIQGNTHFPMSDLNNLEIAELLDNWLQEKKLN